VRQRGSKYGSIDVLVDVQGCGSNIVQAYLDVFEQDGIDKNSPTDTNGPAGDAKSVALSPHSAGEDFCGYKEGDSAPSGCIDEVEEEEHGYGGGSDASGLGRVVAGGFVQRGSLFDKGQ